MISFKEFCRVAKDPRNVVKGGKDKVGDSKSYQVSGSEYRTLQDGLRNAKIFVFMGGREEFSHTVTAKTVLMKIDDLKLTPPENCGKPSPLTFQQINLDIPFESTFFEAIDTRGRAVLGTMYVNYVNETGNPQHDRKMDVNSREAGLLVVEIAPKTYLKFQHIIWPDPDGAIYRERIYMHTVTEEEDKRTDEVRGLRLYLDKLRDGVIGQEEVDERVRVARSYGPNTKKDFIRISKIIRVSPTKELCRPVGSREVDWSHRWLVRGHWRKANGLGKNRAGEYCVSGYTWVVEHEKGPEGAVLVADKVRLFKEG